MGAATVAAEDCRTARVRLNTSGYHSAVADSLSVLVSNFWRLRTSHPSEIADVEALAEGALLCVKCWRRRPVACKNVGGGD